MTMDGKWNGRRGNQIFSTMHNSDPDYDSESGSRLKL